jgi:hypothetical protein
MASMLVSIVIGTWVAVEYHWMWGLVAYVISDFVMDVTVIAYAMKHFKE